MPFNNKAHTATARRIASRYGGIYHASEGVCRAADSLVIAIETWATLGEGLTRLKPLAGTRYIAVTNKEALADALALVAGTPIGVMDPQGNIVHPAANLNDGDGALPLA